MFTRSASFLAVGFDPFFLTFFIFLFSSTFVYIPNVFTRRRGGGWKRKIMIIEEENYKKDKEDDEE